MDLKCAYCEYTASIKSALMRHVKIRHGKDLDGTTEWQDHFMTLPEDDDDGLVVENDEFCEVHEEWPVDPVVKMEVMVSDGDEEGVELHSVIVVEDGSAE